MLARYAALGHDAYFSPDIAEIERDRIFGLTWLYAGIAGDFSAEPRLIETAGRIVAISRQGDSWLGQAGDRCAAIGLCGSLVFFSLAPKPPALESYLTPFFETLRALSGPLTASDHRMTRTVQANWKIAAENALDDYHAASVHPKTLYPSMLVQGERRIELDRAGKHSLWRNLLNDSDAGFWSKLAHRLGVEHGDHPADYRHIFIFPNFYLASFHSTAFILHRLNPIGPGKTDLALEFCMPVGPSTRNRDALKRAALADFVSKADTVLSEDIAVCEAAQKGRFFAVRPALLGALEQRVGDFQDAVLAHIQRPDGR